jgi:hypothetical protein
MGRLTGQPLRLTSMRRKNQRCLAADDGPWIEGEWKLFVNACPGSAIEKALNGVGWPSFSHSITGMRRGRP